MSVLFKFFNNNKKCTNDISSFLSEYKYSIILARNSDGKGVIVYSNNVSYAKSMLDLSSLEIVGVTKYVEPAPPPIKPISNLYIQSVETDTFYSPETSISPLIDILKLKSTKYNDLKEAIVKFLNLQGNVSVSELNNWMCINGMSKYRFLNYKDEKFFENNLNTYTFLDEMSISYIGHHYIWVKNKNYIRPELDILPYNIRDINFKLEWKKLFILGKQFLKIFTFSVNSIITSTGPSIYMITTHPGKCFVNFNSSELVSTFLNWIVENMKGINTIALVGFFSSVFDIPLLKASWPNNSGWNFIGNEYIVSDNGLKVHLIDALKFSCNDSVSDYVNNWTSNNITLNKDFISKQEAKIMSKIFEKNACKYTTLLYDAVNNNIAYLDSMLSPVCTMLSFCVEDMILLKAMHLAAEKDNKKFYVPGNTITDVIFQAIRSTSVKTKEVADKKPFYKYKLKSVLSVIESGSYPVGKPRYVKTLTDGKLYIALCKITVKKDIKIPIIHLEDMSESCCTFFATLTSVDIALVRKIGGYIIKEIEVIEWEDSVKVNKISELITIINKINTESLVNRFEKGKIFPKINENRCSDLLLFYAFAASYCRERVHNLIKEIDSHYLGNVVLKHNTIKIYTDSEVTNKKFLSETCKLY
ncbi:26L protein [Yaba-like disease virus]|uniref:26L protein n=1 Tax=Yaba-like disease virus TaxID=132475 RepID=Q9DHT6_YLDV|nr:26L protein [Yaba-like disease virus]CAC21264.1 26L protein [Yaba-like disease virus]